MKVHVSAPLGVVVNIQTLGGGRDSVGSDDCEANGQKKTLLEVYFFLPFHHTQYRVIHLKCFNQTSQSQTKAAYRRILPNLVYYGRSETCQATETSSLMGSRL